MSGLVLAGDIGGTKTILQLVRAHPLESRGGPPRLEIVAEETYASRAFSDLVPMVRRFWVERTSGSQVAASVTRACFGIAGPVIDQTSELTNLKWSLSAERLQRELGIGQVTLLNDFAAIGHGLAGLADSALATLQSGTPDPASPIAVIGAGTGLGEGFLVPDGTGRLRAFGSEGGHTDFAPRSPLEMDLLTHLRRTHGVRHVSVERVVSGPGIASIYQFLCERDPGRESPTMAEVRARWEQKGGQVENGVDLSAAVSEAALAGSDGLCGQTLQMFVEAYGAEAGNLALKLLCKGGLYVAGGVAPRILPLLQEGRFIEAFRDKGRMRHLMESIPVHIVLDPKVGLMGAALHAGEGA